MYDSLELNRWLTHKMGKILHKILLTLGAKSANIYNVHGE